MNDGAAGCVTKLVVYVSTDFYAKTNITLLLYLNQIFIFLLVHLHFLSPFFFTFMKNLFKRRPIPSFHLCKIIFFFLFFCIFSSLLWDAFFLDDPISPLLMSKKSKPLYQIESMIRSRPTRAKSVEENETWAVCTYSKSVKCDQP